MLGEFSEMKSIDSYNTLSIEFRICNVVRDYVEQQPKTFCFLLFAFLLLSIEVEKKELPVHIV